MTLSELHSLLANAPQDIVVDTEHLPDCKPALANLLGVSMAWAGNKGFYIPVNHWVGSPSKNLQPMVARQMLPKLQSLLSSRLLSGWNIEHDREWLDACFNIATKWDVDGRILWYLSDEEQKERGYGLKKAQMSVLGWAERGDIELETEVAAAGGRLSNGEHYLASVDTLGRYASLDAQSTWLVIEKLRTGEEWLETHHNLNRDYAAFLAKATRRGVLVDELALARARQHYEIEVEKADTRIRELCAPQIAEMEKEKYDAKISTLQTENGRVRFATSVKRHPKFNPNSSTQRAILLHDKIGLPVAGYTETGKRKSDKHSIARLHHPSAEAFVDLSENEKLLQFSEQYIEHASNGLMHFPHDTCATVSERLGGYAPYDLNMPFSSEPLMSAFRLRPGTVGVHMDLVSIEPCLLAGFSGDPTMLKVYRDGLGDIYLDLGLELFPLEEVYDYSTEISALIRQFHSNYDTRAQPSNEIKERFARLRKIAKIIQLSVGYTGTKFTVSKNLTLAGFPTALEKADKHVRRYWNKFKALENLAGRLKTLAKERGYINGLFGRRLYIPPSQTKDALNRFGQHGGHAILRAIVLEIDRIAREDGIEAYPLLPDIHDSTTWEVYGTYEQGKDIFERAIRNIDAALSLPVSIRGEIKQISTFYGIKGKEQL